MGVYISDRTRVEAPRMQDTQLSYVLFLDKLYVVLISRRAEASLRALIYALVITITVAQVVIALGPRVLFWAGVWALTILAAYVAGGLVGLRRGRNEYRPWR